MTSKKLARRLERLEADILPAEEKVIILQIRGITPERQVLSSFELKVHIPQQPPRKMWRRRPSPRACED